MNEEGLLRAILPRAFKGIVLTVPFFFFSTSVLGGLKGGDSTRIRSLSLSSSYTYTLVHTPEVNEVKGSRPIGVALSYQQQFLDRSTWEHCGCYPRTGVLGGWFHLDDPGTLGNSYYLAGFAEPFIWTGRTIDLSIRGVFGGSYLDTPYHPEKNPENQAYSTHYAFFLQVGIHGHLRLSEQSSLKLSAVYDHASNGGVAKPNKGLNHPGFEIGYERSFSPTVFPDRDPPTRSVQERGSRLDLILYGGAKTYGTDHSSYYGFGGHAIEWATPLSSLHTLTFGAEWLVDGALKKELREKGKFSDHRRGSVTFGHEFLMGRFIFSQRIGAYVYDPSELDDPIYHRWGLKYHLHPNVFLGIDLKAHRHIADFIDFRIGYALGHEQDGTSLGY